MFFLKYFNTVIPISKTIDRNTFFFGGVCGGYDISYF